MTHGKIWGLLVASSIAWSMAANAQDTTLDYQGAVMSGTSTTYIYPAPVPPSGLTLSQIESAAILTHATFDASVTYSGSVAKHDLVVDSYEIDLIANNGKKFELENIGEGNVPSSCGIGIGFVSGCVTLDTSGNKVTGATINLDLLGTRSESFALSIGPTGDSFSYSAYGVGLGGVNCSNEVDGQGGTYVGKAGGNPCTVNVSNSSAGAWVQAPEMNIASAAGALTLLLGSVLILRSRRPAF